MLPQIGFSVVICAPVFSKDGNMINLNDEGRKYLDWAFNACLMLGIVCLLISNSLFQLFSPTRLFSEANWSTKLGVISLMMALVIGTWRKKQSVSTAFWQMGSVCQICMYFFGVPFFKISAVLYLGGILGYSSFQGIKEVWGNSGNSYPQIRNEIEKH
jgi:uncharacterized membrane protein